MESDGLSYYCGVDVSKMQAFQDIDIEKLYRLGSNRHSPEPGTLGTPYAQTSTPSIYYSLFLKTDRL